MEKKKKTIQLAVALVVIIVFVGLVFMLLKPSENVVATVNGEDITYDDFKLLYDRVKLFDPDVPKEKIIDQLVSNKILILEAKRGGIEVEDKEVDAVISLTEALYGRNLSDMLASSNSSISAETFRMKLREQLMMSKLLNQSVTVEEPTDAELREFYKNNTQFFVVPAMANVSHILVKTEEGARDIKESLENGANFYELAEEKSIDPSAKMNRGNLGPIPRGATVPEFEEAAFSLPLGVLSDPVKSQFGYHLIKVEGKTDEKRISFNEAKDQVKAGVMQQKQQNAIVAFVNSLLKNAKVKKYLERV